MNEADLRVQRTRRLLREALVALLSQRTYEQVNIRDITRQAQVGYKTFFRHYDGKEALLYDILQILMADFQAVAVPIHESKALEKNTLTVLSFAENHKDLLQALLHSPLSKQLLAPLIKMGFLDGKQFFAGARLPEDLMAHYFVSSMLNLVSWWLDNPNKYTAEEMEGYINELLIWPLQELAIR